MKEPAIKENHLYAKAFNGGRKSVRRNVVVYVLKDRAAYRIAKARRDGDRVNRLGISVRKNVGGAVERNRAKRVIRAAYRDALCECEIKTGNLIVIVARPRIVTENSRVVKEELICAFRQLELTK